MATTDSKPVADSKSSISPPALIVSGKVVCPDGGGTRPLLSAFVRAGQADARTDSNGAFTLRFPRVPRDDLLVRITHPESLPRFYRLDDLRGDPNPTVELTPRLRVAVLDFGVSTDPALAKAEKQVRQALEKELVDTGHITALLEDERGRVLKYLYGQQMDRGAYNKETLVRIGHLVAASHGVFGSIQRDGSNFMVTCKLANLTTGTAMHEGAVRVDSKPDWPLIAGGNLAMQVLAQMADVRILTPRENSAGGRIIKVEGYAILRPKTWDLWLTLVPERSSLHYPQQRIAIAADESWKSLEVYLDEDRPLSSPKTFTVYAVLTDWQRSAEIQRCLSNPASAGLDINAWDPWSHRKVYSIEVTRDDSLHNR